MPFDEAQLNGRIAGLIRHLTKDIRWHVQEEAKGVLEDHKLGKPDIVIRRGDAPPVIIENEYTPGTTLEKDCLSRLGLTLTPHAGGKGGLVSVVFALRSPDELRDCENGEEVEINLQVGVNLEFAVYRGNSDNPSRFPANGFLRGDIRDLVNFIKPASIPEDIVARAADSLTRGANEAAAILVRHSERTGFGAKLGNKLRQPWPTSSGIPNTKAEVRQAKADANARLQTAKMCATMLINACAYQQNLSNHHECIQDLGTVRDSRPGGELSKSLVREQWENILDINYWPIFHIAKELLVDLTTEAVSEMLPGMIETANDIQAAMRQNDIAGIVFQRLIADRKTLKTYYTRPESTVLAAHLGVHDDLDWGNPERARNYRIADYACGTGGLLLAAYQRVRELHRAHGGSPDIFHSYMMENSLTACDIMPSAVHLSSSLLSSVAPGWPYNGTRHILFGFGGVKRRDGRGEVIKDGKGNPVLERDAKGRIIVDIGSLALLDMKSTRRQIVLPINEQMSLGGKGERSTIEIEMSPMSQDLVIMNPPFTRPTKHSPFNSEDHIRDHKNPAFAAFGTSEAEQEAMKREERKLGRNTISDGNAGLGTTFTAIADNMVKSGGRIALILPTSAMMGGSYDSANRQAYSWQRLRGLIYGRYDQIVVVSIAQPSQANSAFSADSNFADCILFARRTNDSPPRNKTAHFVNLRARPSSQLEAQEAARSIKHAVRQTTRTGSYEDIRIGDDVVGFVSLEEIHPQRKWTAMCLRNPELAVRIRQLSRGELNLPQRAETITIPVCNLGQIGRVGPIARDITGREDSPFRKIDGSSDLDEYPMLWNHAPVGRKRETLLQDTMLTRPDSSGVIMEGRHKDAVEMWRNASHLHINVIMSFNGNSTVAAFTERRSLGGRAWPTLNAENVDYEKALCVWLNGTLGMAIYWLESNRTQGGRGQSSVTAIPSVPVLDVRVPPPPAASPRRLRYSMTCKSGSCYQRMRPIVTPFVRSSTAVL